MISSTADTVQNSQQLEYKACPGGYATNQLWGPPSTPSNWGQRNHYWPADRHFANLSTCNLQWLAWRDVTVYILSIHVTSLLIHLTSSAAQGGGGSFKNKKPIGGVSCCDSWMAGRTDGPERCLRLSLSICLSVCLSICLPVCRSICLSDYLTIYLYIYLSIYLSVCLSIYLSIWLAIYLSMYLSIDVSIYRCVYLSIYGSIDLSIYLSIFLSFCVSISELPKVVRTWCAFQSLTSKCASRHDSVQFLSSHLTRWLRTRRFSSEPLLSHTEPQIIGKTLCFVFCLF